MRTYKKKFIQQKIDKGIKLAVETKNAIIWSIDEDARKANVRIQRSNTTISAFFPTAWYSKPEWCKIGSPVRILFRGGDRGKVELLGPGIVIPYPQTGQVWPDAPARPDQLLNGCSILPVKPKKGRVIITVGTLVINNATVAVPAITMADGADYFMGDGGLMGDVAAVMPVGLALNLNDLDGRKEPHTSYRINVFHVDDAGSVGLDTGWEFMAAFHAWASSGQGVEYGPDDFGSEDAIQKLLIPGTIRPGADIDDCPIVQYSRIDFTDFVFPASLQPAIPEDTFWIGEVVSWEYYGDGLVTAGVTGPTIDTPNINFQWFEIDTPHQVYSRRPATIDIRNVGQVLEMDWGADPLEISFLVRNNVGMPLIIGGNESIRASIVSGNGEIKASDGCDSFPSIFSEDPVSINPFNNYDLESDLCRPNSNWFKLTYKRDNEETDVSPFIKLVYENESSVVLTVGIVLYDDAGDPMR